ncbi:GntR family transcriptional regulator [Streptomyces sp. NPDC049881]|uniref:GntR family transcriptional regulator n=1 Tax=unclassified Streptomyces TaxID=2593676 RepID=UPI0034271AF5
MNAVDIRVDTASPVPPFEQIRAQLAWLVGTGRLAAGQRLPPVRQLAADLGLAVGTVARAYRELEAAGLVRTRRGAGTRVCAPEPGAGADGPLERLAREYVEAARALGADDGHLLDAVRDALGR